MSALTGQTINTTYEGLIKTASNTAITGTLQALEDGAGNTLPIEVSTTGVNFTGTVTGLPAGAAGLVNGTGADSLQSAASLTTTPANAAGAGSIALGNGADALQGGGIAIGDNSITTGTTNGIALGKDASTNWGQQIAIGQGATANSVGAGAVMAVGAFANANANESIALGYVATVNAGASNSVAIGSASIARASNSTALGRGADATVSGSVALGAGVIADKVDTVSMKALDLQTASTPTAGGIVMTDAGSTERRINIDASGGLLIDSTPVGGGVTSASSTTKATLTTTGADTVYYSLLIPGGTFGAGDIVDVNGLMDMDLSNGGWIYFSTWISPATTWLSGTSLGGGALVNSIPNMMTVAKRLYIYTSDGSGDGTAFHSNTTPNEQSDYQGTSQYHDSLQVAINWNNNVYINWAAYIDNAGNYTTHLGTAATKIN